MKTKLAAALCLLAGAACADVSPRVILDSDRLDYVSFPQDQSYKLNSGWETDGTAFVRPFNAQAAGVVRYAAVFALPKDVTAELRFEDATGDVLRSEKIAGGAPRPVRGVFAQDGSLARVRLVPSKLVAPKGVFAKPFRITVDWAADEDFTCVPRGTLPAGWRGEKAKAVDLVYRACAGQGRDRAASDAVLEIAAGGFAEPSADKALLTDAYAFEFDALVASETKLSAAGVDLRTLYAYTPDVWYHFRFEVAKDRAKVRLNGRVIAEDVKVSGLAIRNLSTEKLLVDDVKAFALLSPADYPSAPVRVKGEEKWDVIMNICSLWYNGRHAGWRCIERGEGPLPVLGYYDEGIPETADWEIKYMVDHGVDVQAFCWYPESHDGPLRHPSYEYQLRDGFKNARYSDRMKYCLIWEIQNAGRPHSLEAWKKNYVPYLIEHHFKDPRYYAPDGKPMLAVFGGWNFPKESAFGSAAATKAAFDYLEAELKKLGFKGLVTVSSNWHEGRDDLAACGFSARCAYNYGTEGWKVETQKARNLARAAIPGAFVIPTVSVGYDSRPWHGVHYPMMSPEDLVTSLVWVRDEFMPQQKHAEPWQARAVWLSTWNEYGEGTFMMPSEDERGFGYLDAVRSVFTDEQPDEKLNVRPTRAQRERLCHLYPQTLAEKPKATLRKRSFVAACPPGSREYGSRRPGPTRLMVIGAHPDDADITCGGLAVRHIAAGNEVVFVALTDGRMGHHRLSPEETARTRRAESQEAKRRFGLKDYIVLDNPDCALQVTYSNRMEVARMIRTFQPDFVVTHRTCDYHVDHRACGTLVMDAGYLLGVPHWVPEAPAQRLRPVILYMDDPFTMPRELRPDAMIDVEACLDKWCDGLDAQVSQFYDWLVWDKGIEGELAELGDRKDIPRRNAFLIRHWAGKKKSAARRFAAAWKTEYPERPLPSYMEAYEVSEYGRAPTEDDLRNFIDPLCPRSRLKEDWWQAKFKRNGDLIRKAKGAFDVVMFGDSITHYWEIGEGSDESRDIEILQKKWSVLNCGYGGDKIENLLWRLENGELDGYRAKAVTLMIGANNIGDTPEDIVRGVRRAIALIEEKQPEAKIVLHAYLPCGKGHGGALRAKLDAVTPVLRDIARNDSRIVWLDMTKRFTAPDGALVEKLFDAEYLHPSTEGYRVWREELEPVLAKILENR